MNNPKINKVAMFIPSLRGGGAERVMVTLAAEFSRKKIPVDLILAQKEGPYIEELPSTIRVIDLKASGVSSCLPGLVRYLRNERPQSLFSTLRHANIVAIIAAKLSFTGVRVVVREANSLRAMLNQNAGVKEQILPWLMKLLYPYASCVLAVSAGVRDELIDVVGISPSNIDVIYSPIVTNDIYKRADEPFENRWFGEKKSPVIVSAGRLAKQKDFETLITAFELVRKVMRARLIILGEGSLRGILVKRVASSEYRDDIDLPGFVLNPFPYMKHAGVFVLSSLWEGLPNGLVQALALGAPVVSTDCPSGPDEILESGKWGSLVPVSSPELLAEAIIETFKNESFRDKHAARDYCTNKFGASVIADRYYAALTVKDRS